MAVHRHDIGHFAGLVCRRTLGRNLDRKDAMTLETYLSLTSIILVGGIAVMVMLALSVIVGMSIFLGALLACKRLSVVIRKALPTERRWFIKPQRKAEVEQTEKVRLVRRAGKP
jgi:hypothetical protein